MPRIDDMFWLTMLTIAVSALVWGCEYGALVTLGGECRRMSLHMFLFALTLAVNWFLISVAFYVVRLQ